MFSLRKAGFPPSCYTLTASSLFVRSVYRVLLLSALPCASTKIESRNRDLWSSSPRFVKAMYSSLTMTNSTSAIFSDLSTSKTSQAAWIISESVRIASLLKSLAPSRHSRLCISGISWRSIKAFAVPGLASFHMAWSCLLSAVAIVTERRIENMEPSSLGNALFARLSSGLEPFPTLHAFLIIDF